MSKYDVRPTYTAFVQSLQTERNDDHAMQVAIGAEFDAMGLLERALLIQYDLPPMGYLIDVGCGSGRLAKPLAAYLQGRYLGTDVVPELVAYAQALTQRPDWQFAVTDGIAIPEQDAQADMVCFFSVFTHLLHEHTYRYLQEAKRVLKPGGRIVFSFLEFAIPCHWDIFDAMVNDTDPQHPLNMFLSRDAIHAWSDHLDLTVEALHDGDKPHIALPAPVTLDSGATMEQYGNLGQSVCVLVKPV